MSEIAIRVEGLSKQYRLGEREPYKSLRDVIARAAKKPVGWLGGHGSPGAKHEEEYFWALKGVSFEIKRGEAVGIIGRNGAGKSTLLKILSRITKPTRGTADIYGRVGSLLEVGTGFHPELTGRENIYLNGAILGMRKFEIDRKFDEIVEFAGVEKYLDMPVKRYSSGMYVRLAFAVAAHLEPEILLVDEVLAVGDAEFQKKCLGKMGDVASEGRTVLFVSHNMTAINSLCKKTLLLSEGQIIDWGETNVVVNNYLSKGLLSQQIIEWNNYDAPQNSFIRINRIEINTKDSILYVNEPIVIKIRFANFEPVDMYLNLILRTTTGLIIFESPSNTHNFDVGVYEVTSKIPANFLNTGIFSVQINFTEPSPKILYYVENIISFELHEIKRNSSYYGKRSGFFRPELDWEFNCLDMKL